MQAGGVEHVGSGDFELLQSLDGVVEIRAAPEEVLAARGQDEIVGKRPFRFHRCLNALACKIEIVNRIIFPAGVVLDGTAGKAGGRCVTYSLRHLFRRVAVSLFQIRGDRQVGCLDDGPAVGEGRRFSHGTVFDTQRKGETRAGRGQRLESHGRENPGRACVPGIGNDEGAGSLVQGAKSPGLLLMIHRPILP